MYIKVSYLFDIGVILFLLFHVEIALLLASDCSCKIWMHYDMMIRIGDQPGHATYWLMRLIEFIMSTK